MPHPFQNQQHQDRRHSYCQEKLILGHPGPPPVIKLGVEKKGKNSVVIIENAGTMPSTVAGEIEFTDGSKQQFKKGAEVWKTGNKTVEIPVTAGKTVKKVTLGDPLVSDTFAGNNIWNK